MQMVPRSVADHNAPADRRPPDESADRRLRLNLLRTDKRTKEKALDKERRFTEPDRE